MIKTDKPLVTICIPVYNCEDYIAQTIDSILNQSYENFELFISDNCSSDKTFEICQSYAEKDARIILLRNKQNTGFESNWNKCLQLGNGKYYKLIPADDLIYKDCILKQVEAFENNNDIALVFCKRVFINKKGNVVLGKAYKNKSLKIESGQLIRESIRSGTNVIGEPATVMLRRDLIKQAGLFDTSIFYIVDVDYWFKILKYGNAFYINETLSSFRISNISASVLVKSSQSKDFRAFADRCLNVYKYNISKTDVIIGKTYSVIKQILRNIIYLTLFR